MTANEIQKEFYSLYTKTTGERYLPSYARDGKLFKDLLSEIGEAKLRECIKLYFEIEQKIYSPVFFKCRINDYLQMIKKPKKERLVCDESDRYF